MNCKGCWNYKKCEKKHNPNLVLCFKKNESICRYCVYEDTCRNASNTMGLCSEFIEKDEV